MHTIPRPPLVLRSLLCCFATFLVASASAQELKLYAVGKAVKYQQNSSGAAEQMENETDRWRVNLAVFGADTSVYLAVTVTPPGKSPLSLDYADGSWMLSDEPRFATQAAMDADWPDSSTPYTFTLTPAGGGGDISAPVTLDGASYPEAPHISNFPAAQAIRASEAFTLSWDAFAGATSDDFIILSISDESGSVVETPPPGLPGALDATVTSYEIPADTLEVGKRYRCELGFYKSSDIRTGDVTDTTGRAFYNTATELDVHTTPVVTQDPFEQTVRAGQTVVFVAAAAGSGTLTYQWKKDGANLPDETSSILNLATVADEDAGYYTVEVTDDDGVTTSAEAALVIDPGATSRIVNLANRSLVGTGANIMIPGFVISGPGTKTVLVRAIGPTLADFGVTGFLADPKIVLYNGSDPIADNDNWNDAANVDDIRTVTPTVSGLALPEGSADAAILADLPQGLYTLNISGVGATTGVALAEVYEADSGTPTARLVNIANRGYVGTGGDIMIPGFVISGSASKTVLIRAVGPTLTKYGVTGELADPILRVFAGSTIISQNDNWEDTEQGMLAGAAGPGVGAFELDAGSKDAALIITLPPGAYTAQASGVGGATGVALVEVYEVN